MVGYLGDGDAAKGVRLSMPDRGVGLIRGAGRS